MLSDNCTALDLISHDQTPTWPASSATPTASESGNDRPVAISGLLREPDPLAWSCWSGTASSISWYFLSRVAANARSPQLSNDNGRLAEALSRQCAVLPACFAKIDA